MHSWKNKVSLKNKNTVPELHFPMLWGNLIVLFPGNFLGFFHEPTDGFCQKHATQQKINFVHLGIWLKENCGPIPVSIFEGFGFLFN